MRSQNRSLFTNAFAAPDYLRLRGVGLNISDHSVKMMEPTGLLLVAI
jgi:hypothetical protein